MAAEGNVAVEEYYHGAKLGTRDRLGPNIAVQTRELGAAAEI